MDAIATIKTVIYNVLTADAELMSLFNGAVRIRNNWAAPDDPMPYIVYRVSSNPVASLDVMAAATVTFDIFDKDDTGTRVAGIRQRINFLLEGAYYESAEINFRIRRGIDLEIVEDDRYIWHMSSDWLVRYTRKAEMSLLGG